MDRAAVRKHGCFSSSELLLLAELGFQAHETTHATSEFVSDSGGLTALTAHAVTSVVRHACAHAAHASVPGTADLTHHVVLEAALSSHLVLLPLRMLLENIDVAVEGPLDLLNFGQEFVIDDSLELGLVLGIEVVVSVLLDGSSKHGVVMPELSRVAPSEEKLLSIDNGLL